MFETGPAFYTHTLANGLQIVGQTMPDFESVAMSYYVRTGSRDEGDPTIAGVSHFLEHMIFKGCQTFDKQQLSLEFNRIGAEFNAYTSHEATVFYTRVLCEYQTRALELLSAMMHPRLDAADFLTEKEVIINEIASSEDQPHRLAHRRTMQHYFQDHPLGRDVLGTRTSITEMQLEQMHRYWQQRYGAKNIIFSIAGNFSWPHIVEQVEKHCGTWSSGDAGRDITPYEVAGPSRHILVDKNLKQQIIILAMPCVDIQASDYYAATLGSHILGDSSGSRLYWNIYQRGLADSASAGNWAMLGSGLMLLQASTAPEHAAQVLQLLRAELHTLLEEGIGEQELQRAKDKWISAIVLSSETPFARMRALAADWVTEGRLVSVAEEIARVEKISARDVMSALHRYPMRDKQVLTTLGPPYVTI